MSGPLFLGQVFNFDIVFASDSVDSILPITDHLTPLVHVQKSRPKREKNVRPSSVYLPVGIRNDTDESLPDFYRSAQGFAEVYRSKR